MSGSGYFETMFAGGFREKDFEVVSLGEALSFACLEGLVKFLYTEELQPSKEVSLEDLLCAADYLQMPDAVMNLSTQIGKAINTTNVLRFWDLRGMIKDEETISKLREFILVHFASLLEDISFLQLNVETLLWILESDELSISEEVEVFRAIKKWINHDHAAREKHFLALLGCVRYDTKMQVN